MDSYPKLGGDKEVNKEELMRQMQQGVQLAVVKGMLEKVTKKCFEVCVTKPGASLDNYEQKCMALCMDRWLEAREIVAKEITTRMQREGGLQ